MLRSMLRPDRQRSARPRVTRVAVTGLAVAAALTAVVGCGPSTPPAPTAGATLVGIVLWDGTAVVASGTTPAATTVVPTGAGRYQVKFPGLATTGGIVHVTAINGAPHWCQAESWASSGADETVALACYAAGGGADPSAFTALFTSRTSPGTAGRYGYVDTKPDGTIVDEYNSAGLANSVTPSPPGGGEWEVKLPGLGSLGPQDGSWQVTAVNDTGRYCSVKFWVSTPNGQEATIQCFDAAGNLADTRFAVSFQFNTALYGDTPKPFGYIWGTPSVSPPTTTNDNSVVGLGANSATLGAALSLVRFPRIGVSPDTVQVTNYGDRSDFCFLNTVWAHTGGDTEVQVSCFARLALGIPSFLVSANTIP